MSTTNDHKRRKYNEEEDSNLTKKSSSSAADSNVEEEEEEDDDDDGSDDSASDGSSCSTSPTTFVAWLDKPSDNDKSNNNNILSIGELHFSNAEHIVEATSPDNEEEDDEEKDDGSYCIVCQLKLVPNDEEDEESDLVYTFKDSFPFRVLKSSSCIVGLPLIPIAANGLICNSNILHHITDVEKFFSEEEGPFDYLLSGDLRISLLQELQDLSQSNGNVSPNWKASIPINDKDVIDGINSWWKAGEGKTGWDLSKIPKEDYTTLQTIHEEEKKKGSGNDDSNILMSLYKDLCAFEPLVMDDNLTRDMIEDRFEWRTCLWYVDVFIVLSVTHAVCSIVFYMDYYAFVHFTHIICSFLNTKHMICAYHI